VRATSRREPGPGAGTLPTRRPPTSRGTVPQTSTGGGMTARPWVIGLADLTVGLPLRVSAGIGPDFPHGRAIRLSGEHSFLVGAEAVKHRGSAVQPPQRRRAEPVQ